MPSAFGSRRRSQKRGSACPAASATNTLVVASPTVGARPTHPYRTVPTITGPGRSAARLLGVTCPPSNLIATATGSSRRGDSATCSANSKRSPSGSPNALKDGIPRHRQRAIVLGVAVNRQRPTLPDSGGAGGASRTPSTPRPEIREISVGRPAEREMVASPVRWKINSPKSPDPRSRPYHGSSPPASGSSSSSLPSREPATPDPSRTELTPLPDVRKAESLPSPVGVGSLCPLHCSAGRLHARSGLAR